jgi:hypothetical protein
MKTQTRRIQTLDGLPVYDATEPLIIEIIKADIHARDRKNPEKCALAQACKRELHVTEARAYLSRLYVKHGDHWLRYQLPEAVRQEVASFDRGGGFSQGTYRIPPLPQHQRAGGKHRGGNGPTRPGTGTAPKRQTHRQVEGLRAPSPLYGGAIEHKSYGE